MVCAPLTPPFTPLLDLALGLSLHTPTRLIPDFSNTSTSTQSSTYQQVRGRVVARLEAPTSPGGNQTPDNLEDGLGAGPSLDQGPSGGDSDQNDTSHNDAAEATAEFNRVVTTYNATPSVVRNAQSFMRVRSLHISPSCFLTDGQLRPRTQLLHLHLAVQEIRSNVNALAHPDGYEQPIPSALGARRPPLRLLTR